MTTREEYAEAAELLEDDGRWNGRKPDKQYYLLAARVLRHLAEGKVLCDGEPVAFRYRYGTSPWTLTREPTAQWAQDHSGFEERPLYAAATQGETS